MPRILIVEDEESMLEPLQLLLSNEGFQIECAKDGISGLKKFQEQGADLVLLDLMLPGIDGIEVCKKIIDYMQEEKQKMMESADYQEDEEGDSSGNYADFDEWDNSDLEECFFMNGYFNGHMEGGVFRSGKLGIYANISSTTRVVSGDDNFFDTKFGEDYDKKSDKGITKFKK